MASTTIMTSSVNLTTSKPPDDTVQEHSFLWIPYFLLSSCLLGLTMTSFIRFHIKNKKRYRDNKDSHALYEFRRYNFGGRKRSSVVPLESNVQSSNQNGEIERISSVKSSTSSKSGGSNAPGSKAETVKHPQPLLNVPAPRTENRTHYSYLNYAYTSVDDANGGVYTSQYTYPSPSSSPPTISLSEPALNNHLYTIPPCQSGNPFSGSSKGEQLYKYHVYNQSLINHYENRYLFTGITHVETLR